MNWEIGKLITYPTYVKKGAGDAHSLFARPEMVTRTHPTFRGTLISVLCYIFFLLVLLVLVRIHSSVRTGVRCTRRGDDDAHYVYSLQL